MKAIKVSIALLLTIHIASANAIDSLQSLKDVNWFLTNHFCSSYLKSIAKLDTALLNRTKSNQLTDFDIQNFKDQKSDFESAYKDCENDYKEVLYGNKPMGQSKYDNEHFIKVDLNNDGLTDLIINGSRLIIVIDLGNNRYGIHEINTGEHNYAYSLTNIINKNNEPLLIVSKHQITSKAINENIKPDTLIYKYGDYIEYKANPVKINFTTLDFKYYGNMEGPTYSMKLNNDRTIYLYAFENNYRLKGEYVSQVDSATYNDLSGILAYIALDSLKEKYKVSRTESAEVILKIEYNGKTKEITDYGLQGTKGLSVLYDYLVGLKSSLSWHKKELPIYTDTLTSFKLNERILLELADKGFKIPYNVDNPVHYEQLFVKSLLHVLQSKKSFKYTFPLISNSDFFASGDYISIKYSADSTFRVFNWISPSEHPWSKIPNVRQAIFQAKNPDGKVALLNRFNVDSSSLYTASLYFGGKGLYYDSIIHLRNSAKQLYLCFGKGEYFDYETFGEIDAFEVRNDSIITADIFINDDGKGQSSIIYGYKTNGNLLPNAKLLDVCFNGKSQSLRVPKFTDVYNSRSLKWTGRNDNYLFDGEKFNPLK